MENWIIIIPARLNSTRLPEKPLQLLGERPLIQRVYENLKPLLNMGAEIIIATDSQKVIDVCDTFGAKTMLTDTNHKCGSDRCNEVSLKYQKPFVLNVQGDEPFTSIDDLLNLAKKLEHSAFAMATLAFESTKIEKMSDPNVVKVVTSNTGKALYFSRSCIPSNSHGKTKSQTFLHHMGIYGYRKEVLEKFCSLPPSYLEEVESLEQLRALENNIEILVLKASKYSPGIDTPADLEAAHALL